MQGPKIDMIRFQKYMKPSGCCQACLSQNQLAKDCIITCEICRSCIHQTHYGSELLQPPQIWRCQRCRYFTENGPEDIRCQFCPNLRGIMKQFLFENRKIWLHPECAVWGYPIIFFVSAKKEGIRKQKPKSQSTNFWVPDYETNPNPCQACNQTTGYRLKCKYYSCKKSYHVTCARPQGIIRDLESMKIQNGIGYFPVYCKQHIELKIEDCKKRVKLLKDKDDIQKAAHYQKLAGLFVVQLNNLEAAVKKCRLQQEMIKKMSFETRRNIQGHGNINFNQLQDSFSSQQSQQFLKFLENQMIDESLPLKPIQTLKSFSKSKSKQQDKNKKGSKAPKKVQQKVTQVTFQQNEQEQQHEQEHEIENEQQNEHEMDIEHQQIEVEQIGEEQESQEVQQEGIEAEPKLLQNIKQKKESYDYQDMFKDF